MMATSWDVGPAENRQLYRPVEVAQMSGLSRAFIYRLIERGALKSVRIGSAVRISVNEVQRLLTEGIPERE
jgi:excisionase family DNA binding protein